MLKLINPWVIVALIASHGVLLGWAGSAEYRLRGAQVTLAQQQADHDKAARAAAQEIARLQEAAINRERAAATELAAQAARFQQEQRDAQAQTDSTLADLRSGNLRLRQRLSAAQCPTGLPSAAAGAGGSDAAAQTGLRQADADFLVRESDRADAIVRELTLCQATISQYRQLAGGDSSTAPSPGTPR